MDDRRLSTLPRPAVIRARVRRRAVASLPVALAALPLLVTTFAPRTARADEIHYTSRELSVEDGISESSVESIAQDHDGYLWLGTQNGLNRYDGVKFVPFFTDDGLPSNHVKALAVDDTGVLWAGTTNGLAVRRDARFVPVAPRGLTSALRIVGDDVYAIVDGAVVHGVASEVRRRMASRGASETAHLEAAFRVFSAPAPLASATDLAITRDHAILVGTRDGVFRIAPDGAVTPAFADAPGVAAVAHARIDAVAEASNGDVYVAVHDGGVFRVASGKPGEAQAIDTGHGLRARRVTALEAFGDTVWASSIDDGAAALVGDHVTFRTLPAEEVRRTFVDREQNVWAATLAHLERLVPSRFEVLSAADGLPSGLVFPILHAADGATWIGTTTGLARRENGRTTVFTKETGLPSSDINCLAEGAAPAARLCVGTNGAGIACRDGAAWTRVGESEGLGHATIYDMMFDGKGQLWAATDEGVTTFANDRVVRTLRAGHDGADGLLFAATYALYEAHDGAIWIGYWQRSGLSAYRNGVFTHYTEKDGLPRGHVNDVLEDARGQLWAAGEGGLSRLDKGRFRAFTTHDGLPNNNVYRMIEDDAGALWLSTDRGVAKFDGARVVAVYRADDGLSGNEGMSNGGAKDRRGRIWFSSTNGISIIDPARIPRNEVAPRVVLEAVTLGDERIAPTAVPQTLTYDRHNVTFEFTAASFRQPRAMMFEYMLDGFDSGWTRMNAPVPDRRAVYTNLPPGTYTFNVRATNDDGVWSDAPATLRFGIAPPWWKTWWAFTLWSATAGLVVAGVVRARTYRLGRAKQALEALVAERTRELQQAQVQLVHQEKMAGLGQLVAGVAHELSNPINFISGNMKYIEQYAHDLQGIVSAYDAAHAGAPLAGIEKLKDDASYEFLREDLARMLRETRDGAERVREIIHDLRTFSRLDEADRKRVDIHVGIDSTLNILRKRLGTRISVQKEYGALPNVECYPGQLNQVFMNLLANAADAIPESRDGTLRIRTEVVDDAVRITIADDGAGMTPDVLAKVWNPFFTTKPVGKGTGLGLSITHGIVERHAGKITVESSKGSGTTFTVEIPIRARPSLRPKASSIVEGTPTV